MISVFTASITTIMAELINGHIKLHEIRDSSIGVIVGSIERHMVIKEGGKPLGMIFKLRIVNKLNESFRALKFISCLT